MQFPHYLPLSETFQCQTNRPHLVQVWTDELHGSSLQHLRPSSICQLQQHQEMHHRLAPADYAILSKGCTVIPQPDQSHQGEQLEEYLHFCCAPCTFALSQTP